MVVIGETLSAKLFLVELEDLDHGPHGAIEEEDSLGHEFLYGLLSFSHRDYFPYRSTLRNPGEDSPQGYYNVGNRLTKVKRALALLRNCLFEYKQCLLNEL
jgi:hypothetical protein